MKITPNLITQHNNDTYTASASSKVPSPPPLPILNKPVAPKSPPNSVSLLQGVPVLGKGMSDQLEQALEKISGQQIAQNSKKLPLTKQLRAQTQTQLQGIQEQGALLNQLQQGLSKAESVKQDVQMRRAIQKLSPEVEKAKILNLAATGSLIEEALGKEFNNMDWTYFTVSKSAARAANKASEWVSSLPAEHPLHTTLAHKSDDEMLQSMAFGLGLQIPRLQGMAFEELPQKHQLALTSILGAMRTTSEKVAPPQQPVQQETAPRRVLSDLDHQEAQLDSFSDKIALKGARTMDPAKLAQLEQMSHKSIDTALNRLAMGKEAYLTSGLDYPDAPIASPFMTDQDMAPVFSNIASAVSKHQSIELAVQQTINAHPQADKVWKTLAITPESKIIEFLKEKPILKNLIDKSTEIKNKQQEVNKSIAELKKSTEIHKRTEKDYLNKLNSLENLTNKYNDIATDIENQINNTSQKMIEESFKYLMGKSGITVLNELDKKKFQNLSQALSQHPDPQKALNDLMQSSEKLSKKWNQIKDTHRAFTEDVLRVKAHSNKALLSPEKRLLVQGDIKNAFDQLIAHFGGVDVEHKATNKLSFDLKGAKYNSNIVELGTGAFGIALKISPDNQRDSALVIKMSKNSQANQTKDAFKSFQQEIKNFLLLESHPHPNVQSLKGVVFFPGHNTTPPKIALVTELAEHGTLTNWKKSLDKANSDNLMSLNVKELLMRSTLAQIMEGMAFMQKDLQKIHYDLKPDNILVHANGRTEIADLGTVETGRTTKVGGGTSGFTPPEIASVSNAQSATYKFDVWSLGLVAMHFVVSDYNKISSDVLGESRVIKFGKDPNNRIFYTGNSPSPSQKEVGVKVDKIGPFEEMINSMMHPDPTKRPTLDAVANLKFFSDPMLAAPQIEKIAKLLAEPQSSQRDADIKALNDELIKSLAL